MNETIIEEVESHKYLGLLFHEDGNWHVHVNHIIEGLWFFSKKIF